MSADFWTRDHLSDARLLFFSSGTLARGTPRVDATSNRPFPAQVTFSCDGETAKSTTKKKDLNPVWIEEFKFAAFDSKTSLRMRVMDHDEVSKDDFMGRADVKMGTLRDKRIQRLNLKLAGEAGRFEEERGEIEVFLAWRTNPRLKVDLPTSVQQLAKAGHAALHRAAKGCENPNFKGSYLGRFPLVLADLWTSDHLSERSRSMDVVSRTRARGTAKFKRR